MILQIIFAVIFYAIGVWYGYNKSQKRFGAMMERGEVMYKSPLGWMGHPDAFKEIKKQEHEWDISESRFINRVIDEAVEKIKRRNKK